MTFVTLKCLVYTSWNLTVFVDRPEICKCYSGRHVLTQTLGKFQTALMVWLRAVTLWATNSPRTSDAPPTVSVKTWHIELFFYMIKKETCQHDSLDLTDIPVQFLSPIVESPESIIIIIIILYYATGKRRLLWEKGEINDSGISASWWEVRKMESVTALQRSVKLVLLQSYY